MKIINQCYISIFVVGVLSGCHSQPPIQQQEVSVHQIKTNKQDSIKQNTMIQKTKAKHIKNTYGCGVEEGSIKYLKSKIKEK